MVLISYLLLQLLYNQRYIEGLESKKVVSAKGDSDAKDNSDEKSKDNSDAKAKDDSDAKAKDNSNTKTEIRYKSKIEKKAPDEYLDRDPREHGGGTVLSETTFLKTMTPTFLTDHLVESKHDYRWIPEKWPKCKDKCSHQAINRKVACWGRNTTPYSDDITLDKLFTIPANQKDEMGDTACDRAKSGLTVNVKPHESSFCSLINDCSEKTIHPLSKLPVPIEEEKLKYDRQSIGFSAQELIKLPPEQQKVLKTAFSEIRVEKVISGRHGTMVQPDKSLNTTVKKLKLHMSTLTDDDKKILVSGLKAIKLKTQSEKTYDIGSLMFSTFGISI